MTHPQAEPRYSTLDVVVAVVCGVVGGAALLGALFFGGALFLSALASDPSSDPHGYAVVFGVILGVPCALVAAITLPAVFPPGVRPRAYGISAATFVVLIAAGCAVLALFG